MIGKIRMLCNIFGILRNHGLDCLRILWGNFWRARHRWIPCVRDEYQFFSSGAWMQVSMECRYMCSMMGEKQWLELDVRLRSYKPLVVPSQFFIFVNHCFLTYFISDFFGSGETLHWNHPAWILVVSCTHCPLSHQVL